MKDISSVVQAGDIDGLRQILARKLAAEDLDEGLRVAIRRGDLEAQKLLVAGGADVNFPRVRDGWRPLHSAVEHRRADSIQLLVESGADLDCGDAKDATPLHLAVDLEADEAHQQGKEPSVELIALLLELGADRSASDANGQSPSDWARDYEFETALRLLASS